jgi:hypothetical protein
VASKTKLSSMNHILNGILESAADVKNALQEKQITAAENRTRAKR